MRSFRRARTLAQATFAKSPSSRAPGAAAGPWVTVGKAADVTPGAIAAFSTASGRVAVANVAGAFYAFGNTCTHRHCALAEGDLEGTVVTCICHGSQFDVTSGAVRRGPAQAPVPSYPVRREGDDLQVQG
jgi:nitrite reductase/ring-hydroxylating ferredoxin subunit